MIVPYFCKLFPFPQAARTDRCPGATTARRTAEELEVETLSQFFSSACRPGPWSANSSLDADLSELLTYYLRPHSLTMLWREVKEKYENVFLVYVILFIVLFHPQNVASHLCVPSAGTTPRVPDTRSTWASPSPASTTTTGTSRRWSVCEPTTTAPWRTSRGSTCESSLM